MTTALLESEDRKSARMAPGGPARSTRLDRVQWHWRKALGLSPADDAEILYWLRREAALPSRLRAGSFRFPWGRLDYVNAGHLRSQFEEIFVGRQYAFTTDTPNPVIVDCGGNVGISAVWFKLHYPGCRLTVYEADTDLADLLRRNLRRLGFDDVAVRCEAVWVANETVRFHRTGGDSGRITPDGSATCRAIDLSECLPARVDLLKMDVEGAEYPVLDRLCQTGAIQRVRQLVCEFHVWRDKTDALLQTLARLRTSGMQLSMNAAAVPWIGTADEEAPFAAIQRHHVLMEVFAWHIRDAVA
jgi:FkbM family methyltransferase